MRGGERGRENENEGGGRRRGGERRGGGRGKRTQHTLFTSRHTKVHGLQVGKSVRVEQRIHGRFG
eukprot:615898-Pleurochrysis_carterae.AAC.1